MEAEGRREGEREMRNKEGNPLNKRKLGKREEETETETKTEKLR